jgi:hypothetical protein
MCEMITCQLKRKIKLKNKLTKRKSGVSRISIKERTDFKFHRLWLSACKKLKLDPCLSPCTSINSNWIKDLNITPKTLKLVQKRAGNTLETIGIGKDLLNRTAAAQQLRERMDKWNFIKLKSFCTTKEMVSKLKRTPTEWKKIFASNTSDKRLITRIYRELKKLNSPKINEIRMAKKHMKKMLTISGHKGNANQNHTKIPPHPC